MKLLIEAITRWGSIVKQVDLTAEELANVMFDDIITINKTPPLEQMNQGVYQGTSTPLRKIQPKDVVHLLFYEKNVVQITDDQGGWIANRFEDETGDGIVYLTGRRYRKLAKAYL